MKKMSEVHERVPASAVTLAPLGAVAALAALGELLYKGGDDAVREKLLRELRSAGVATEEVKGPFQSMRTSIGPDKDGRAVMRAGAKAHPAVIAHELGHQTVGPLQKALTAIDPTVPLIRRQASLVYGAALMPFLSGVLAGKAYSDANDDELDDDEKLKALSRGQALNAVSTIPYMPTLIEEARASAVAAKRIGQLKGRGAAVATAARLLPAFGTYAATLGFPAMSAVYAQGLKKSVREQEKQAASKVDAVIRAASPARAQEIVSKLFRIEGVRPPYASKEMWADPKYIEQVIKSLRTLRKVEIGEIAPRGSDLWRSAMKDIRAGRVNTFESGLSQSQGENMLRVGASTQGGGSPLMENMPAVLKRLRSLDRDIVRSLPDSDEGDRLYQAWARKKDSGLYAADAGTRRTSNYANDAAAADDGVPAALRFELPEALATTGSGKELRIHRNVLRRWGRNPRVEKIVKTARELPVHAMERAAERTNIDPEDVARLQDKVRDMKLERGETYYYPWPEGGYSIIGPTFLGGNHRVKTTYAAHMRPRGTRLPLEKLAGTGFDLHGYSKDPKDMEAARAEEKYRAAWSAEMKRRGIGPRPQREQFRKARRKYLFFGKKKVTYDGYAEADASHNAQVRAAAKGLPEPPDGFDRARAARIKTPFDKKTNYKLNANIALALPDAAEKALYAKTTDFAYSQKPKERRLSRDELRQVVKTYKAGIGATKKRYPHEAEAVDEGAKAFIGKAEYLLKNPHMQFARLEWE